MQTLLLPSFFLIRTIFVAQGESLFSTARLHRSFWTSTLRIAFYSGDRRYGGVAMDVASPVSMHASLNNCYLWSLFIEQRCELLQQSVKLLSWLLSEGGTLPLPEPYVYRPNVQFIAHVFRVSPFFKFGVYQLLISAIVSKERPKGVPEPAFR